MAKTAITTDIQKSRLRQEVEVVGSEERSKAFSSSDDLGVGERLYTRSIDIEALS
jgi:hypothetical protein